MRRWRLTLGLAVLATLVLALPVRTAKVTPFVLKVSAATFTNKQLAKGALSTTLTTTLYTVPALTTTIVNSLTVANANTTTARNITIDGDGRKWLAAYPLAANQTIALQINHALPAAALIRGGQDTGTDCDYYISGVEIT